MGRTTEESGTLHFEFQWGQYDVEGTANVSCTHYHDPGCKYLSNGDPGYPPEDEWYNMKVHSIDEVHLYENGDEVQETIDEAIIFDYIDKHYEAADADYE